MNRKPDLLIVITLLFIAGAAISSYALGGTHPDKVASHIAIR